MNRGQTLNTLLVSLLVGCGTVCGPESFTIFRWFVGESPTKTKRLTEDIHIDGNASWCLWAFSDGLPTKNMSAWHRDRWTTRFLASLSVSVFLFQQYAAMNHFLLVLPWKGKTTFLWCKPTAWKSEP